MLEVYSRVTVMSLFVARLVHVLPQDAYAFAAAMCVQTSGGRQNFSDLSLLTSKRTCGGCTLSLQVATALCPSPRTDQICALPLDSVRSPFPRVTGAHSGS
jgi:hypothetical protein